VPPEARPPTGRTGKARDAAAEDYRRKTEHEVSSLSRRLKEAGYPAPLGEPTNGVVLVVEQPVGPRVLDALSASLLAVGLPEAYVTYASTGLLKEELLATDPQLLVAVGPGAARELDELDHPFARRPFAEADEGVPFAWTRGAVGLRLPPLAPALDHDESKRHFWRCFLALKNLAP
jgi:hypothetical protein